MSHEGWRNEGAGDRSIAGLARKLGVQPDAAATFFDLLGPIERYPAGAVVSSISPEPRLKWIVRGWACEERVLHDGRRQIFSFAIPGDVLTSRPPSAASQCSVVTLTSFECVDVARVLARAGRSERIAIQMAVSQALTIAVERRYEGVIRIGRHSATRRMAEFFLDLSRRLEAVGMADGGNFFLPLTQKHLADALGLSAVQVNRSLKILRDAGLATFRFGRLTNLDREQVEELCRP